jgi:soluble lytic murein transglycosylase
LLELAYPRAYASLVEAAGRKYGVSPLLLLALIRQESFYDPQAISVAGALGLTQVIPETGMEIAERLGQNDFDPIDLLEPSLSIEFGAFYLADRRAARSDRTGGLQRRTGQRPALARRPDNRRPDFLVETIDLEETRSYLEVVLDNYAVYRFLYCGLSRPTLLPS